MKFYKISNSDEEDKRQNKNDSFTLDTISSSLKLC